MQSVSNTFHQKSQAGIRKHRYSVLVSFEKDYDSSRTFFTLDSSNLDDTDVLAPVGDNPLQYWDYYSYASQTDRIMSMEWSRQIDFPYSTESSSASVVLSNIDNYYSSHTNSPINQYLLAGRPIKLFSGYENESLLQQFVGLTQGKPELDQSARTARFEALDYLSEMFQLQLSKSVVLTNVRTDQVLAALFTQFGLSSSQYSLARGRNVIPFVYFEAGKTGADYIRSIMQAEGGQLWIDEEGIIRFDQRLSPANGPIFTFDESNIVSIATTGDTEIVNRVKVVSNIRVVQAMQLVHAGSGELSSPTLSEPLLIPASGTNVYTIDLKDPVTTYYLPLIGRYYGSSWFTVATLSGTNVTSNVSVVAHPTLNQISFTLTNTNAFDVYLNAIEVWATPAKIVDTLHYEAFDQSSIDAYGEHVLDIKNDMFGSESNCESFAYTILDAYASFDSIVEMSVKGNPALQLGDVIWINTNKVVGQFKIIKIANTISSTITQTIRAKRYNPRYWFMLDESSLDGTNVLAP